MRLLRPSSLALPPLRLRREDIGPLVEHFLGSFCARRCGCVWGVTREAMDLLEAWPWPGNVRELRDAVRFAVATGSGSAIEPKDLPPALQGGTSVVPVPEAASGIPTLAEAQLRIVQETLARFGGNKSRTARALAISRHKLYDMLEGCG
jgi:DNA-binding NtrC family response regulator